MGIEDRQIKPEALPGFEALAGEPATSPAPEPEIVSGVEMADWLGVSPAAVTQMKKAGVLKVSADGGYQLKASIKNYIATLRARKAKTGDSADLDRSLKYWDVEAKKQKVTRWRIQYGREIGQMIIDQCRGGIELVKATVAKYPGAMDALKKLSDEVAAVDIDDAVFSVDNEDADDASPDSDS